MTSDPQTFDHVVVGAGVAAAAAVQAIRSSTPGASIAVLGAEPDPPVYRPDLSKKLWLDGDAELAGSTLLGAEVTEDPHVDLRTGAQVTAIDLAGRTVTLADGGVIGYGDLLLATGAEPRTTDLPPGPRVLAYRTAADYRALAEVATPGSHVAVVGGGSIGGEMASALAQREVRVTLVLDGDHVQSAMFPDDLAQHVTEGFTAHGVEIVHGLLLGGEATADDVTLRLESTDWGGGITELTADAVVVGIGVSPRTGLAEAAGLTVDDGIVVDAHLRTSDPHVYAAGDVASYPDALLGRRRVEHVDHAEKTGATAGRVMAGEDATYDVTPIFWSDLFDDGYEAIGEVRSELTTVEDWADDDHGAGVVYYLDDGRVVGVLLWNVWDSTPAARALIAETAETPVTDPESLRGQIPTG